MIEKSKNPKATEGLVVDQVMALALNIENTRQLLLHAVENPESREAVSKAAALVLNEIDSAPWSEARRIIELYQMSEVDRRFVKTT